jgi:uncharacterized membrane protein
MNTKKTLYALKMLGRDTAIVIGILILMVLATFAGASIMLAFVSFGTKVLMHFQVSPNAMFCFLLATLLGTFVYFIGKEVVRSFKKYYNKSDM